MYMLRFSKSVGYSSGANIRTTERITRCSRFVFSISDVIRMDFASVSSISAFSAWMESHLYIHTPFSK